MGEVVNVVPHLNLEPRAGGIALVGAAARAPPEGTGADVKQRKLGRFLTFGLAALPTDRGRRCPVSQQPPCLLFLQHLPPHSFRRRRPPPASTLAAPLEGRGCPGGRRGGRPRGLGPRIEEKSTFGGARLLIAAALRMSTHGRSVLLAGRSRRRASATQHVVK